MELAVELAIQQAKWADALILAAQVTQGNHPRIWPLWLGSESLCYTMIEYFFWGRAIVFHFVEPLLRFDKLW